MAEYSSWTCRRVVRLCVRVAVAVIVAASAFSIWYEEYFYFAFPGTGFPWSEGTNALVGRAVFLAFCGCFPGAGAVLIEMDRPIRTVRRTLVASIIPNVVAALAMWALMYLAGAGIEFGGTLALVQGTMGAVLFLIVLLPRRSSRVSLEDHAAR